MKRQGVDTKKLPDSPGVYLFKRGQKVLYVGKATSLRDRVRSYFSSAIAEVRGPLIVKMLEEATSISFEATDSVLEALVREAALIKKYQPTGNVKEKDDKSWNYVVLTNEDFPKVMLVRGRDLALSWEPEMVKCSFGPFISGSQLKEALKIIRKIFPYRDEKCVVAKTVSNGSPKPCFNRQLGLCPGTCTGEISKSEYAKIVRNLKLFFEGKKSVLVRTLERDMRAYARAQKFEKAGEIKRQLFALKHINDIALLRSAGPEREGVSFRIEAFDVAHIAGTSRVGVMVVVDTDVPNKNAYRKFNIKTEKKGDTDALREILERRLAHAPPDGTWPLPKLIVVDGSKAQLNVAESVLKEFGYEIPVVGVVKDERHRPRRVVGARSYVRSHERAILLANNEAHRFALAFHTKKRGKII